jgi:GTP-binding protein Era
MAEDGEATHRAGFVALLGPPNAGKSTLLNRLLGEKLAIVTAKPQTTRSRILGIVSRPHAQILLVDTPGLHDSERRLNVALNETVSGVTQDCDVAVLLVDARHGWTAAHDTLLARLLARRVPVVVACNKADLLPEGDPGCADLPEEAPAPLRVSARTGEGVEALLGAVASLLPESPALYPEDELTDRPVRWLCAELIREAAFECLEQELPYELAVEVTAFDEGRPDLVTIRANLLVARSSQKGMVIGAGGRTIKRIGVRARKGIERLVGRRAHLDLFVKVDPLWLKSQRRLEELGYR